MDFKQTLALIDSLMPAVIGGSVGLLAIVGLRELLKETMRAFHKSASI